MAEHIRQSIENAVGYLSKHPEESRYADSSATAVIEGLKSRVEAPDGSTLVSDMPTGVGGGGSAPSPGWLLRAAIASCDATAIAMRAAQQGIELSALEVTVDSESDDQGLVGMDDSVPAGPLSTRIRVRIAAEGVPPEKLREIVEWADHHSPASDAVKRAVPTTLDVDVLEPNHRAASKSSADGLALGRASALWGVPVSGGLQEPAAVAIENKLDPFVIGRRRADCRSGAD